MQRNINKSLRYANKVGANKTIIIGKDEWSKNKVIVKNMQSGEQKEVPTDTIADFLL
jgi:histidyl-tRNA synthetase